MVLPTMVPSSVGESNGLSDPTISKLDTSDLSQGENSSSDQSKQPPTSRWKISGKMSAIKMFQKRFLTSSAQHGEKEQKRVAQQPEIIGQVGVVDGKSIPWSELQCCVHKQGWPISIETYSRMNGAKRHVFQEACSARPLLLL